MWHSQFFLEKDLEILEGHTIKYKSYLDIIPGHAKSLQRFYYRIRKSLAGKLQRWLNLGTRWAISYGPEKMYKVAKKENADLYAAHLECAFFAGRKLVKAGKKVSFDFEDWYSRDYLVAERPVALLKKLEKFAVENGTFCTAASRSMATALEATYEPTQDLTVIYNGFCTDKNGHAFSKAMLSDHRFPMLWFSRTIGQERGLEYLFNALEVTNAPIELHLLGELADDYKAFLEERFSRLERHKVVLHPFIAAKQLPGFISKFNVALAIEEDINDNKSLTISNKILQYLQEGLHVIASDTAGQKEVADVMGSQVTLVDITKADLFADTIDQVFGQINRDVQADKTNESSMKIFSEVFSWEAQERKLENLLKEVSWE